MNLPLFTRDDHAVGQSGPLLITFEETNSIGEPVEIYCRAANRICRWRRTIGSLDGQEEFAEQIKENCVKEYGRVKTNSKRAIVSNTVLEWKAEQRGELRLQEFDFLYSGSESTTHCGRPRL